MLGKINFFILLFLLSASVRGQRKVSEVALPESFTNIWANPPQHIPNNVSIDAPLMGNGDVTMSVGYQENRLRYYLSKNDFWRLRSKADGLSGPRVAGFVDIKIDSFNNADFSASQFISNGVTTCILQKNDQKIKVKSWVQATQNLVFIEVEAISKATNISIIDSAPENPMAALKKGEVQQIHWLTRAFNDSVDIPTEVAVALKTINYNGLNILLQPDKKLVIVLAIESKFKNKNPLNYILGQIKKINENSIAPLLQKHDKWWETYWNKSSISLEDTVLMKAYYQGLYTMAACSRDVEFPPGIFGWTTTDTPAWNGDYHLNYNFQAPFYGLYAANRLGQGTPQDAPLIDFMPRGEWYAKNVTHTRGILYPVGIGPLGIETTRDFQNYMNSDNFEKGGLFFGQRSDAAYGLINIAEHWRCTYDKEYGRKTYPYALAVVDFWEDYLKFENGRYVIYGDAIHEGSGKDKNPVLSLGLVRNALNLILDLSSTLKIDQNRQAKWEDILSKLSSFHVQIRNDRKVFRYTEGGMAWNNGNGLGIQQIYPANAITLDSGNELLAVSRNTIDEMQRWEDMNTSSSFFVAAIRVGYDSNVVMKELHKYALHTYPNGFQLNNPHGIENSCTVANALDEMLCMSVGNVIRLFRVFPKDQNAEFKNIRAWGAFLVSAKLTDGIITHVKILSEKGKQCAIINPWPGKRVVLIRNGKEAETISGNRLSFKTSIREMIQIKPV
jgi:alpha-L-fucosidase 2